MRTKKALERFVSLMSQERFFEAHEAIEEIWFKNRFLDAHEVKFQKGLINAAVSFELLKKGKIKQSKNVWRNYLKYRQLLFKIDSVHLKNYNDVVRYVDGLYIKKAVSE